MLVYKLTDLFYETFNKTKWGENVTHTSSGIGELCSEGWIHFYDDPNLAIVFNPIHACIAEPILWEAEALEPFKLDKGIKFGTAKLTTIRIIDTPSIHLNHKIAFAILCSLEVYKDIDYYTWAINWLNKDDRTASSAYAAYAATADSAAYSTDSAAYSTYAAYAAYAASANAAYSAAASAAADTAINLKELFKKAKQYV